VSFRPQSVRGADGPGEIDYRLARQAVLSEFRKGRIARHEVCDAHPELVRAAKECAQPTRLTCPVCEQAKVVLVSYVFGPRLPAFGRCITSKRELQAIAKRSGTFTCYVVEVCPECAWNHLARTFVLSSPTRTRAAVPSTDVAGS
jgi:ssDNA-binding Zn-finger/Zn-ribbon topoisomerase 1